MKLHYKAPQRQLSQDCTIFIDSDCVICKNYVRLCRNLQIMQQVAIFDQLCRIAPSHFIRGPDIVKKSVSWYFETKKTKLLTGNFNIANW